ncbi:3a9fd7df-ea6d-4acd-b6b1-b6e72738cb02 [Thermothielavioides terrestris]|uniref:3a9fd7df-ea6d-4acd-b6b1-b6e72738cb02 n=1 Tax=Thermothielavioides terrestris TaxID=2587410 RepID=A0A3S4AQM8_9PEZI|nr:3a9fd7df-ea6d-4acd-b6b1-b6e72738cb02 [Thermothielavioides terrestris]
MDDETRSLKAMFADAESKRLAIENATFSPNSPEYADAVSSAIKLYQACLGMISVLAIFSPNESLEDLSTTDLPFLLTHFHLAELTQRLPSSSPQERKRILSAARDAYEHYLHQLDTYGLLSPRYQKLLEQYTDSPTTFSMISTSDPAARRDAKIAIFKAEKELRAKLDYLRQRPEYGTEDGGGDEGAVRQAHLAHLDYSTHMAFQALESLNREWEVLALAPSEESPSPAGPNAQEQDDARRRQRGTAGGLGDNDSDRLDAPLRPVRNLPGGPLLSQDGKPLQPFTLLNTRQELARGVFRPGHNLPTMTIDEYLEEERRRGGIIEGGGEASLQQPEPDEDDIEKADAETMKARAWDEFVEANPRGSGNTLNRG